MRWRVGLQKIGHCLIRSTVNWSWRSSFNPHLGEVWWGIAREPHQRQQPRRAQRSSWSDHTSYSYSVLSCESAGPRVCCAGCYRCWAFRCVCAAVKVSYLIQYIVDIRHTVRLYSYCISTFNLHIYIHVYMYRNLRVVLSLRWWIDARR